MMTDTDPVLKYAFGMLRPVQGRSVRDNAVSSTSKTAWPTP